MRNAKPMYSFTPLFYKLTATPNFRAILRWKHFLEKTSFSICKSHVNSVKQNSRYACGMVSLYSTGSKETDSRSFGPEINPSFG